jgi:hypothetical protein
MLVGVPGPGRGKEMVIRCRRRGDRVRDRRAGRALLWVEAWTFRQNQSLLTFRASSDRPEQRRGATDLRYDTGGDYLILTKAGGFASAEHK